MAIIPNREDESRSQGTSAQRRSVSSYFPIDGPIWPRDVKRVRFLLALSVQLVAESSCGTNEPGFQYVDVARRNQEAPHAHLRLVRR
jgi:hypothetical protein